MFCLPESMSTVVELTKLLEIDWEVGLFATAWRYRWSCCQHTDWLQSRTSLIIAVLIEHWSTKRFLTCVWQGHARLWVLRGRPHGELRLNWMIEDPAWTGSTTSGQYGSIPGLQTTGLFLKWWFVHSKFCELAWLPGLAKHECHYHCQP